MKKLLKFAPLCALLFGIVAFVLMMVTHPLVSESTVLGAKVESWYSATAVLFGKGQSCIASGSSSLISSFEGNPAWNAILAFIFMIVGLLALLVSALTVFVEIKPLEKFGGIIALAAAGLLLVGGIFLFFAVPAFAGANEFNADGWNLGAGWIVAAILAIVGGLVSACPAVLALIEKK